MITTGKAFFTCPMTGKEVSLHEVCQHCDFFKHWSWSGAHPILCCDPPSEKLYKPESAPESIDPSKTEPATMPEILAVEKNSSKLREHPLREHPKKKTEKIDRSQKTL